MFYLLPSHLIIKTLSLMKSKVIFAIGIATMAAISCEKTDYVDPASPGTAIIKGTLFAPIDLSNDTTSAGTFVFGFKN